MMEDSLSIWLSLCAAFIVVYFFVWLGTTTILLIPIILLILGITLRFYVRGHIPQDVRIDEEEAKGIGKYTLLALIGISMGSLFSRVLFRPPLTIALSTVDQLLYGTLYAISEEQFFRGFVVDFFLWKTNPYFAILASAAIFTVYHLRVYGSSIEALMYVLIAGVMLAWVAWKSRRTSPSIIAHICNNLLSGW